MPQLVKLHKTYKDKSFVVVANQTQDAAKKEDVVSFLRSVKAEFTGINNGRLRIPDRLKGLPASFLFDSKGKLVASGRPHELKPRVVELIKTEPHHIVADREFKTLGKYAILLKKTDAWGKILTQLAKASKKDRFAEEAAFLIERIEKHADDQLLKARAFESTDALKASDLYTKTRKNFKGHEASQRAADALRRLKKDDAFQIELEAALAAQQIFSLTDKLVSNGRKIRLDFGPNKSTAGKIRHLWRRFRDKYGESAAARKLKEELSLLGFEV